MKLNRSHSLTAQRTNNKVSFHFMSFIYLFILTVTILLKRSGPKQKSL